MGMGKRGIDFVIGAVDKFSAPMAAFNAKMAESTAGLRTLGSRMGSLGRESGLTRLAGAGAGIGKSFGKVTDAGSSLAGKLTLIGGAAAYGFKKGFVDVASQFEKSETILNTLNMGDTAKSKKEMGWISDFAAKTPYELAEVTEAFVQLRSYGMEPMNGLLATLGDTSSAMGKPLKQAVEAIADAVTGENERLKEFGIVGKKVGDKIVYSYTNAAGAQTKMMAKASDRAAIQATLTKVWAEKYGGGMDALSKTFGGMMSNLSDAWSRFAMKVMSNGAFDWMKNKLSGILNTIDIMSADGRLDAWAKQWGERLTTFLGRAWEAGKGFAAVLGTIGTALAWTADLLGGWENMGKLVLALMGVQLIAAVGQLAVAFVTLGAAFAITPLGALAIGFAVVGAAIVAVMTNWERLMESIRESTPAWLRDLVGMDGPKGASGRTGAAPSAMMDFSRGMGNLAPANPFGLGSATPAPALTGQTDRPSFGAAALQRQIQETKQTLTTTQHSTMTVDFSNVPRGTEIRSAGAPVDLGIRYDMGLAMPEAR